MRYTTTISALIVGCMMVASGAAADTFPTVSGQIEIDFVSITGDASGANETNIGQSKTFTDPGHDFRIGTFEVTQGQWNGFKDSLGVPITGTPTYAYDDDQYYVGEDLPVNKITWYEAAQFTNWLNTSTGHHPAYRFTGTQGETDYSVSLWTSAEADNGTNLIRHKDAFYFLPTEDEWVKAAYWNGSTIQTYATRVGESLHQGDGVSGTGWNYYDGGYALDPRGPWNVGSGSEELNGTYDMMGNAYEWVESPYLDGQYAEPYSRAQRGGSFNNQAISLSSDSRLAFDLYGEQALFLMGFRVAAAIPEPSCLALLSIGGMCVRWRRNSTRVLRRS
ncbi:MAG TPA: SUMF1/EgtB/PvdO family nonheme iron enzyme [Phycisphaerae bacterium]|nr:SUMF1/EgtB/PvdO family nonheme iron enzyme [Phycisphaerales bacterium]HNO78972.1 SUMF1/EgtB/PvdO family nonheme iron enzyme [Phycisphaerae bacterium]